MLIESDYHEKCFLFEETIRIYKIFPFIYLSLAIVETSSDEYLDIVLCYKISLIKNTIEKTLNNGLIDKDTIGLIYRNSSIKSIFRNVILKYCYEYENSIIIPMVLCNEIKNYETKLEMN